MALWGWVDPTLPYPNNPALHPELPYPLTIDENLHAINPDQGPAKDCFFLAALSSFFWMNKVFKPQRDNYPGDPSPYPNGKYKFTFFDQQNAQAKPVYVTPRIPMTILNNKYVPYYARSNRVNEFWPALFEKAWVNFKQENIWDRIAPQMDKWLNITGSPGEVLRELTGKPFHTFDADLIDKDLFKDLLGYKLKTAYPTVAWTHPTFGGNNTTGLVANHSYSILGGMEDDGVLHIILRDPYGHITADPSIAAQLGKWDYGHDVNLPIHEIDLPDPDGIFGVDFQTFNTYFHQIAYVNDVLVI
jgi:hypothetical protein